MDSYHLLHPEKTPAPVLDAQLNVNRRYFFGRGAAGIGGAALASLLGKNVSAASALPALPAPHVAPKARRVIYLFQNGASSPSGSTAKAAPG
jgi:hypothetical protein